MGPVLIEVFSIVRVSFRVATKNRLKIGQNRLIFAFRATLKRMISQNLSGGKNEAERKVREIAVGSQAAALNANQSRDVRGRATGTNQRHLKFIAECEPECAILVHLFCTMSRLTIGF
jgi:hypothetical protein